MGQVYRLASGIHRPVEVKAQVHLVAHSLVIVAQPIIVSAVVDISPVKEILEKIGAIAIHILGIATQLSAHEGHLVAIDPLRPVGLGMERIDVHITLLQTVHAVASPSHMWRVYIVTRTVISNFKSLLGLGMAVLAASQLIPLVTIAGHTVAVAIHAHHDDAWLAAASRHGNAVAAKGVAKDLQVILTWHIDQRMVEAKGHIAAITAQRDKGSRHRLDNRIDHKGIIIIVIVNQHLNVWPNVAQTPRQHRVAWLAGIVFGQSVDKLSRRWPVVKHAGDVTAILCLHHACHHQQHEHNYPFLHITCLILIDIVADEDEMCRYVAGQHIPLEHAVAPVAV